LLPFGPFAAVFFREEGEYFEIEKVSRYQPQIVIAGTGIEFENHNVSMNTHPIADGVVEGSCSRDVIAPYMELGTLKLDITPLISILLAQIISV
jgi:hypothetical protein